MTIYIKIRSEDYIIMTTVDILQLRTGFAYKPEVYQGPLFY